MGSSSCSGIHLEPHQPKKLTFPKVYFFPEHTDLPAKRYDSGDEPATFRFPKEFYRAIYYEFVDNSIGEINKRFDQKNFTLYLRSEQLLIHATANSGPGCVQNENLDDVKLHFGDDFDYPRLSNQLSMLHVILSLHDVLGFNSPSLEDIKMAIFKLNNAAKLFSEVLKLLQMLYVKPATTATAERSFSALRRPKTLSRSQTIMTQCLSHNV